MDRQGTGDGMQTGNLRPTRAMLVADHWLILKLVGSGVEVKKQIGSRDDTPAKFRLQLK